jgi:hypothetical protein
VSRDVITTGEDMDIYRQGDILIERAKLKPSRKATRESHTVLAEGEATGHLHQVVALETDTIDIPPAALFTEPDGTRVLIVDRPCNLTHHEHSTIPLAPGAYRIGRQREYSPEEIRTVAD